MLEVKGRPNIHLEAAQPPGSAYPVEWVDIDDPSPVPVHARRAGADDEQRRDQPRRPAGLGSRRGVLLAPGGRDLRPRRRLLHLDAGRRPRGDEHRPDRERLRQRQRPDLGVPHPRAGAAAAVPVAAARRARLPRQRHTSPRGTLVRLRGQRQRQLPARADPARASCSTSRSTGSVSGTGTPRYDDEFAGSTFIPGRAHAVRQHPGQPRHDVRHLGRLAQDRRLTGG